MDLPFEQDVNPFVEQAFEHKTFFSRLHHFVLASDAYVVVPGGIGTVLETMMVWQLLQVRHVHGHAADPRRQDVARPGWNGPTYLLGAQPPLASPEDLAIPRCVDTADEAIALIRESHAQWARESKS